MTKIYAIANVIAWSGFWAFGYLALTADPGNTREVLIAALLAALGGGVGVFAYLRCARYCEMTGYAKGPKYSQREEHHPDADTA